MGWMGSLLIVALVSQADGGRSVRYLALGDSFTIGTSTPERLNFPSQLKGLLEGKGVTVRLTNAAVNGFSTHELIERELPALEAVKPTHVTLAIGANDLVRGKGPAEYRARLKVIFARLKSAGVTGERLLVLPQPDWSQAPIAEAFGDRDELRARIESYNAVLADEARAAGASFVELWPLMIEQGREKLFAADGLHPNQEAYTAWAQALAERWARAGEVVRH